MAYQSEKQTQGPVQDAKALPEEQFLPGESLYGLPNSSLMAAAGPPPPGFPNSVMREMFSDRQIPAAEAEADRLSAGITSGTPESVRSRMGRRLGSDFSSVRFHSGPESVRTSESMGARAYTRGSDVYFGRGGFDPAVAAHELVHTVQQRAVTGHVSQSVSFGTVQMWKSWTNKLVDQVKESESPKLEEEQRENAAAHGRPVKVGLWQRFRNFLHRHNPFARRRHGSHDHLLDEEPAEVPSSSESPALTAESASPKPKDDDAGESSGREESPKLEGVLGLPLAADPDAKAKIDDDGDDSDAVDFDEAVKDPESKVSLNPSTSTTSTTGSGLPGPEHHDEDEGSSSGSETTEEDLSEADDFDEERDDEKDERIRVIGPNEIRLFWGNKTYDISVKDSDMDILDQQLGEPEEDEDSDDGPAVLSVVLGKNNEISIVFDNFDISGQVIKETGQDESEELSEEDDDSIMDEEDEEDGDENDPLIDRQVQAYIRAHNAMARQGMEQDKGRVSTGGVMGKAKQAADLLGAGQSLSSLITEADRVSDTFGVGGLDSKFSSLEFETEDKPVLDAQTSLLGTSAALISTATNAVDTVNNAKKIGQGANPVEMVASGTKTLTSAANAGASGVKFLSTVGASGVTPALDFIPFAQAGSGAFNSIVGFGSGIRHRYHLHKVHEQQRELARRMQSGIPADAAGPEAEEEAPGVMSVNDLAEGAPDLMEEAEESPEIRDEEEAVFGRADDDEEEARPADDRSPEQKQKDRRRMMRILRQMEMVEERKRTGGTVQGTQGLVAFGGGLTAALAGPLMPAASAAIGGASAGLALGRFAYDKKKKSMTREQVISEDLGIDWKRESAIVRRSVPYGKFLTPIRVRKIILKAYGFRKGTRHEAYAYLTQQRANFMWDQMNSGNEDADIAENAFNAVGVHRRKGRYQEGAKQLLAQYMM